VERFDVSVLPWVAGRDEQQFHDPFGPGCKGSAGRFGPVVHAKKHREPVGDAESFEDPHEVFTSDGHINGVIEDHAGVFVDDGGDFEYGAFFEVVGLEIDHLDVIVILRTRGCFTGGGARCLRRRWIGTLRPSSRHRRWVSL